MSVFSRFLTYFDAVARYGSIRRASEELRIAASAIDRQILQGEQFLGTPLFERLPSGMRLTSAGELLAVTARRWIKDFDDIRRQIDDLKGLRQGEVTLLVPEAFSGIFLPPVITRLRVSHPGIVVNIVVQQNAAMISALAEGLGDIALVLDPEPVRDLIVRSSFRLPLGIVSTPEHPVAQEKTARFSVCAEYPVIMPSPPLALCRQLALLEAETGIHPSGVASANNVQMLRSLVASGIGIGILSYPDAMDDVQSGRLIFTPLMNASARSLTLALCHDRTRRLSGAVRLVLAEVEKECVRHFGHFS